MARSASNRGGLSRSGTLGPGERQWVAVSYFPSLNEGAAKLAEDKGAEVG